MKIKNSIIFSVFFLCLIKAGHSTSQINVDKFINNGIEFLYNYEFDNAIIALDSARIIDPEHPVPPFVLISAKWLKVQNQFGYDSSYAVINYEVNKTIPVYKKLIELYPNNSETYLYLGSAYGMRARTALASKKWLNVLYSGYQGIKYIRKAQAVDSLLKDVYTPIGIMEYFSCLSSSAIKWSAKLAGISANCELGLEYLEIAAKESHYSWIEASNILTYAYLHIERDYIKASTYIVPLVKKFPGHPYFLFLKGELLAKTQNWDSLNVLMPDLEMFANSGTNIQMNECKLKLAYILALQAYYNGNYFEAINQVDWIQNNYSMEFDWLKGFAYMLRAKCNDALGKFNLAKSDYSQVLKLDDYYPEVREAKRRIKELKGM